jgi:endonuclease III
LRRVVRMSSKALDLRAELLNVARLFYDDVSPILRRFESLSPFELLISTIVSQNTNWKNVERAMKNMRERGLVTVDGILRASLSELEDSLRVAGLYRVKARRIKEIAERLRSWGVGLEGGPFHALQRGEGEAHGAPCGGPQDGRRHAGLQVPSPDHPRGHPH